MSKQETRQEPDASYDPFARVYNRHWNSEVPSQIMTVIDRLFVPEMALGARILDLCCGTGYTDRELSLLALMSQAWTLQMRCSLCAP